MKLNPQTTAFVFPGQGSQAVGMGKDLAAHYSIARETFEEADTILGFHLSQLMWEGPDTDLNDTINTQPALYIHSLAAYRTFSDLYPGFHPVAVAGHSLGELSALTASGALSFSDGLRLVRTRGELMKRAGQRARVLAQHPRTALTERPLAAVEIPVREVSPLPPDPTVEAVSRLRPVVPNRCIAPDRIQLVRPDVAEQPGPLIFFGVEPERKSVPIAEPALVEKRCPRARCRPAVI